MREDRFDAWTVRGPEHLVGWVTYNRQAQDDAVLRGYGGGFGMRLGGKPGDQITCVGGGGVQGFIPPFFGGGQLLIGDPGINIHPTPPTRRGPGRPTAE